MTSEKKDKIIYWMLTTPFILLMLMSAVGYLMALPELSKAILHLGYPLYIAKIVGTAKLLGVIAIVTNRSTLLKEWAYAGFTINMIGAIASHVFNGDSLGTCVMPSILLTVLLTSYVYWKKTSLQLSFNN
jgi:hypothetical protein